jgi:hypothetical protein
MAFADAATARTCACHRRMVVRVIGAACGSHRTRFRLHRISEPDVSRLNIAELTHADAVSLNKKNRAPLQASITTANGPFEAKR